MTDDCNCMWCDHMSSPVPLTQKPAEAGSQDGWNTSETSSQTSNTPLSWCTTISRSVGSELTSFSIFIFVLSDFTATAAVNHNSGWCKPRGCWSARRGRAMLVVDRRKSHHLNEGEVTPFSARVFYGDFSPSWISVTSSLFVFWAAGRRLQGSVGLKLLKGVLVQHGYLWRIQQPTNYNLKRDLNVDIYNQNEYLFISLLEGQI